MKEQGYRHRDEGLLEDLFLLMSPVECFPEQCVRRTVPLPVVDAVTSFVRFASKQGSKPPWQPWPDLPCHFFNAFLEEAGDGEEEKNEDVEDGHGDLHLARRKLFLYEKQWHLELKQCTIISNQK